MIVVFDGQCLVCNGSVQFLLRHDSKRALRFAAIQTEAGRALVLAAGLRVDSLETFLFVDGDRAWRQTAALFRVCHALGGFWRLAWIGWIVPAPLRDALYGLVARNRFRFFPRQEVCMIPRPEDRSRFL